MHEFDLKLRVLRQNRGLTIGQLAEKIGSTQKIVGNWERGTTEITLGDALKVCRVLGCNLDELAGWESTPTIKEQENRVFKLHSKVQQAIDEYQAQNGMQMSTSA